MAASRMSSGSTDFFGTFLETVEKRHAPPEAKVRDVQTILLLALRTGEKLVSDLVSSQGPSISDVTDALERLAKYGLVAFDTTPDGSRIVRLTNDGVRAAEKAA